MDYISEFKKYLVEKKGVSQNTFESYVRDITQFNDFWQKNYSDLNMCEAEKTDIEAFIDYLKTEKKSSATATRMLASIRSFYQYLMFCNAAESNPAKSVKLERVERKSPEIMTSKEVRALLSAPNVNDSKGARDKAMLEVLYACGIRVSELTNLNISDVRCAPNEHGEIVCRGNKGTRTIPMHQAASDAVRYYINSVRPMLVSADSDDALFINLNGSRLTRQGFWKIIKTYAEAAKIKKEITPHTLRHSFAMHLYQNGASLQDLQAMLGHADISSTQMYANISRQNSYADVYDRCHPLAVKGQKSNS